MRNGINQRSGVHIVIDSNTKIPSIVSKGLSVMPGAETNIGLTSEKFEDYDNPSTATAQTILMVKELIISRETGFAILPKFAKECAMLQFFLKFADVCIHHS